MGKSDQIHAWELCIPYPSHLMEQGFGVKLPSAKRLKRLPPMRETQVWSLGREDPLEKEMARILDLKVSNNKSATYM